MMENGYTFSLLVSEVLNEKYPEWRYVFSSWIADFQDALKKRDEKCNIPSSWLAWTERRDQLYQKFYGFLKGLELVGIITYEVCAQVVANLINDIV